MAAVQYWIRKSVFFSSAHSLASLGGRPEQALRKINSPKSVTFACSESPRAPWLQSDGIINRPWNPALLELNWGFHFGPKVANTVHLHRVRS